MSWQIWCYLHPQILPVLCSQNFHLKKIKKPLRRSTLLAPSLILALFQLKVLRRRLPSEFAVDKHLISSMTELNFHGLA